MSRFVSIIIFFLLAACVQQTEKKPVDLKSEEQAIRSLSMKWLELDKAHDVAGQAALYADDGVTIRENEEPAVGPTAIQNLIIRFYEQNPKVIPNWGTDRVEIAVSGDLAVEYGSWSGTDFGPTGTEEDHGKYITVYRKVNGIWKVASDISLSTKPEDISK